ncbi:MAG: hypothetical protein QF437_14940 [Planctomycetota bacterium]|jgi:hypothetical protein|nr:hypothetical protein [Planctomycetota bacterium]MDP7131790.1 hypothetical protein [Planctomycetota bacterium]
MSERQDSIIERMKKMPLWQWGCCFIFGAMFSNMAAVLMIQSGKMRRAQEKATQLGVACAGGLLLLFGIVLIVMHFVKRRKD